jgi:hypothetical protein
VLLKQPGAVPAGAGGEGWTEELAPFVWQSAQTEALSGLVFACVVAALLQGADGCGALTPWQVKQDALTMPPEKSAPWHDWQEANPPDWVFAGVPCASARAQPAACPVSGLNDDSLFAELHPVNIIMNPNKIITPIAYRTFFFISCLSLLRIMISSPMSGQEKVKIQHVFFICLACAARSFPEVS